MSDNLNFSYKISIILLLIYVVLFNPFITDVFVPIPIRFLGASLFYISAFLLLFKKADSLLKIFFFIFFSILLLFYWLLQGTFIISNSILVLSSIVLFFIIKALVFSDERRVDYLTKIWNIFIWGSVFFSILSFIIFNFLGGASFIALTVGGYDESANYFSPFFGIVSIRHFLYLAIGRVAWLFSEPSYLGFFHGLNFFWFKYRYKKTKSKFDHAGGFLSILALIFTFSLGSWVAIILSFFLTTFKDILFFLFNKTKITYRKIQVRSFLGLAIVFIFILNYNSIAEVMSSLPEYISSMNQSSSLDDRSNRIEGSIKMINNSSFFQIFFGHGPGSIEKMNRKGESNGWIKSFIEQGIILTSIYFVTVINFIKLNHRNTLLFFFIIISFNSIVMLFSPLVIVYLSLLYSLIKEKRV